MSEKEIALVEGNGNVFYDFEDPDPDLKQVKAVLAARIIAALDDRGFSVRKAAGLTRFAAADFSCIRNADRIRRPKGLHVMSGFPLIFLTTDPLAHVSNFEEGRSGPAPYPRGRMLVAQLRQRCFV